MSMINGIRIVDSILNSALTSAQLNTLLGNATNYGSWLQIINSKIYSSKLVNNPAAMEIVVRSALALASITVSTPFYALASSNRTAIAKLLGASAGSATVFTDIDTLTADATAMGLVAGSATSTALLVASLVAASSFAASSVAVTAFASATPLTNIAKSSSFMAVLLNSPYAINTFNTSALRKVIAKSSSSLSVWFQQLLLANVVTSTLNGNLTSIASNGTNVVAATTSGLWYSTNAGATWTSAGIGLGVASVIYAGGKFVAARGFAVYTNAAALTSPDGITWTSRTVVNTSSQYSACALAYGNGRYVLAGSVGMESSPDAITWTAWSAPTPVNTYSAPIAVAFGNGRFAALGGSGTNAYVSADGINWQTFAVNYTKSSCNGMVFGNGIFVASNSSDAQTFVSPDAYNWTVRAQASPGSVLPNGGSAGGMSFYNGVFYWPVDKTLWAGVDGYTWSAIAAGNGTVYGSGVHDGSIFLGLAAKVAYS